MPVPPRRTPSAPPAAGAATGAAPQAAGPRTVERTGSAGRAPGILESAARSIQRTGPSLLSCPHCGGTFDPHPAGGSAAPKAQSSGPVAAAGAPATILVVEDTEFFQQYVTEVLKAQYRPIAARTADEALRLLQEEAVKVLILDLALESENDGLPVLERAAALGIPSLIFTARDAADLYGSGWAALQERGASDLLIKAMNIEDSILNKVSDLLHPPRK
jgi:CheY-like chemotaxis protein